MTPGDSASPSVLVLGGLSTDYVVQAETFVPPGGSIQGATFLEGPGGKGLNGATCAARLGARVTLVGRVGSDARGQSLLAHLSHEGVDAVGVVRDAEAPTGATLVVVSKGGGKQTAAALGANQRVTPADVTAAAARLTAPGALLVQLEVPLEAVEAAVRLADGAGVPVVLDPAPPRELPTELLRRVHLLRPNASEAEALTGVEVRDETSARRAASALLQRGVGAVVVSAPSGSLLATGAGAWWLPNLPVDSVDSTGAGDASAAALAVALAEGKPLTRAVAFAHAAAALATTRLGATAGLPRRDEVLALLRREGLDG